MLLFFSTYCSIVPLWQSKQVTECDWGRCSELSWHRGRTDQLWIVLYRQISPPVHAIHGVILCVCVRGKSGYYGSVLTRSTVTCVYCWLGHAAPPTPAAVRVTQKRIPADFLFGRTLLIETSVHMLRSNDESPRAMAASKSSPCWTLCEDCPRSRGNTLIWRVQASFGIKTLAVFNLSLMIWIHCSEAVILRMVSCLSTVVWSVGGSAAHPGLSSLPSSSHAPLWLFVAHTCWGLTSGTDPASNTLSDAAGQSQVNTKDHQYLQ